MATKSKSKAKQAKVVMPKQYFAACSRCHQIVSANNLQYIPDTDKRVDPNRADLLVGECIFNGCNGACYMLSDRDNEDMNEGITLVRNISSKLQRGYFIQGIIAGMATEHRSHQQAYGRLITESIRRFAKEDTDLRNEAFVKFCQKCLPIAESNDGLLPAY